MQKNEQTFIINDEKSLDNCIFHLEKWDRIFFYGDLWAGKTTFIRALLRKFFQKNDIIVRSPTYTYYQQYENIYHFDLYRLEDFETFYMIGWAEIAESPDTIMLVEWPEILGEHISPSKKVEIVFDAKKMKEL